MTQFNRASFQQKLDAIHQWPTAYTFKFIVPTEDRNTLKAQLPTGIISERASRNGRYTSLTIRSQMQSSDAVMAVYEQVAKLDRIIAL